MGQVTETVMGQVTDRQVTVGQVTETVMGGQVTSDRDSDGASDRQ